MEQINELILWLKANITLKTIIDIVFAIGIYCVFRLIRKSLAYITIKIFRPKLKNNKDIKNNGFYKPLKMFYSLLGLYIAIMFLKEPLDIKNEFIFVVNKIYKIAIILLVSNGIANSLTTNSKFTIKLKEKMNPKVEDPMFKFVLKAIKVLVYAIAGFLVITELGYNLNGLVAGLGVGGVIITLAAQDTAKNLIGGLVIFLDKPFIVGDWIQVDKYEGTVEDITFRSTRIRTFENCIVNIPNSTVANASIINWSKMDQRRNKVNLCLKIDTPLEKIKIVQDKIKNILIEHEDVIEDSITVKFDNITSNGINLLIYSYTSSVDYASFLKEREIINFKIMKILKEENVQLA